MEKLPDFYKIDPDEIFKQKDKAERLEFLKRKEEAERNQKKQAELDLIKAQTEYYKNKKDERPVYISSGNGFMGGFLGGIIGGGLWK